ncbi:MAG TPA: TPM domain-containing protein [Vicinamibacteria bacterium]|jgi:uncharacterized membrane protein
MKTDSFLQGLNDAQIVSAVAAAERRSRGEVRVHVSARTIGDVEEAAAAQFHALGMDRTAERNGVLVYVAPESRKFAVIGDRGIDDKAGADFWRRVADDVADAFRQGQFTAGIVRAVEAVGDLLAAHFPRTEADDRNELPDELTRD